MDDGSLGDGAFWNCTSPSTLLRLWGISGAATGAGQEAVILYPPQSTLETPWAVTFSIPLAFELL